MARQVARLIDWETNRSDPSHITTFTPPAWLLSAVVAMRPGGYMQELLKGRVEWK
jgi:hypothetical protein